MRKKTLKLLAALSALVLMVVAPGCSKAPAGNTAGSTSAPALKPIVVGVDDTYPPMEFVDDQAKSQIGFDIDFAKALFKEMGREVKFESTAWSGIFSSLESKKFDCIISSISITPERKEKYNMSKPYVANKVVLVTAPSNKDITSLETLSGKKVSAQTGTTADDIMDEMAKKDKKLSYAEYETVMQAFDELKLGRVDAVLVDIVVAKYYVKMDPSKYKLAWESSEAEPIGVCMHKDDTALAAQVNTTIDKLIANGTMAEISKKWFGDDITKNLQ